MPARQDDALGWAMTAMRETTERILRGTGWRQRDAFAVITEAVWWTTMVDATLMRYYPGPYSQLLQARPESERLMIEDTFGGLRFVRNQMGYTIDSDQFIDGCPRTDRGLAPQVAAWRWKKVALAERWLASAQQQDWELARYSSYTAQLSGQPIGATFAAASCFAEQVFAQAEASQGLTRSP